MRRALCGQTPRDLCGPTSSDIGSTIMSGGSCRRHSIENTVRISRGTGTAGGPKREQVSRAMQLQPNLAHRAEEMMTQKALKLSMTFLPKPRG
jgi:hypothetical protein